MDQTSTSNEHSSYTNYVSFQESPTGRIRVGHYDLVMQMIHPLSFRSGTPLDNLYQVIEVGEANIASTGASLPASSVKILTPFPERDVLCVGKNYAEHAKEFNSSGFDSSDKVDTPSHPVIFTKRFTSIIAHGEDIYPHTGFTQTADYEGEIGVIIGKPAFRVSEEDAMSYVWGYTIVNDMTARERQRDHKRFYLGKSPDTFCPMGPIAVPASRLDKVLRVQTHVNGELRQNATTEDLIFSVPFLIKTMSEGQTLMPGDVLATGTPAGVGIGRKPPVYLRPGDTITVSVNGLGALTNRIGNVESSNPIPSQVERTSHLRQNNAHKASTLDSLTLINNKRLFYKSFGESSGPPIVFMHGLGGDSEYFNPLIQALYLEASHSLHSFDFEGLGRSPTSPLSVLSIQSFAEDVSGVFEHAKITSGATLIAHSMGCLVAVQFVLSHPDKVSKLVLLGPPVSPFSEAARKQGYARADTVRAEGMQAIVDDVVGMHLSDATKTSNQIAVVATRLSLLSQDPEGYAKACVALACAEELDFAAIKPRTLFVTGSADTFSPPVLCERHVKGREGQANVKVLQNVGHWHIFEDLQGTAAAIRPFLSADAEVN
ncbi:fumarylacetoacetate hydrolase-like protein [Phaeosphaeria sp. MPI-PUGE-AT-0046c]|nr:fumarylacetoacetate hydrolase-like protein [Phaeosphaeria sp. MPI-PUGE-AT-0046c]